MEVFVVPVGRTDHELYCEVSDDVTPAGDLASGVGHRLARRFREVLAAAERERHHPAAEPVSGSLGRLWHGLLRRAAEAIAEQRLLWHLRRQRQAILVYPDDLSEADARAILQASLARDRRHHRFWSVADAALAATTGPLFFFVPGPNLIAYYFVFRFVGHLLAWRGARQGLERIAWTLRASGPLAEIRRALSLSRAERDERLRDVASRLQLAHLAAFVRRTAV